MFEIADVEEAKPLACRGCLATERPLRPLDRSQASLYEQLTGTPVSWSDIYPKFLCSYCRALLVKFSKFKEKCLSAQETFRNLHSTGIPITTKLLTSSVAGSSYAHFTTRFSPVTFHYESENLQSQDKNSFIHEKIFDDSLILHDSDQTSSLKSKNLIDIEFVPEEIDLDMDVSVDGKKIKKEHDYVNKKTRSIKKERRIKNSKVKRNHSKRIRTNQKQNKDVIDTTLFDGDSSDRFSDTTGTGILDSELPQKLDKRCKGNKVKITSSEPSLKALQVFLRKIKSKSKESKAREFDNISNSKLERYYEKVREASARKYNVTIVKLSKEEQLHQFMARQEAPRYKNARYQCELCYTGFPHEYRFKTHMAEHEPREGDYLCDICNQRYTKKTRRKHLNHRFNYVCNKCGFVCQTMDVATIHYRSHKGTKYECKICGKKFNRSHSVYGHMHLSHGGSVRCSICGETFIGEKGLRSHINMSHKEAVGAVCGTCGVQFHSHDALRRHLPQDGIGSCDHTHRPCAECGEGFPTEELLQQHIQEHHSDSQKFICDVCGRVFESLGKYRTHMHGHVFYPTKKPTQTKHQNKTPTQKRERQTDPEKSSVSTKILMCEICGVVKQNPIYLASHMRSHTKPFQCDYCQRRFSAKSCLESHIYLHMSIPAAARKQYQCRYCTKTFIHGSNRLRHEKGVHLKQQSFTCELCGSTYQYKESLQAHINTKHLGMPWPKRIRNQRKK